MSKLIVSFNEFIEHAFVDIERKYGPTLELSKEKLEFMKRRNSEMDSLCYEIPDYVTIQFKKE